MRKVYSIFLVVTFILFACNKISSGDKFDSEQTIIELHKKASSNSMDSTYVYLNKAKKIIEKGASVSDSLIADTHFLLGLYFREKGNLDSASVYFHNATDYVNDSIYNLRQHEYFERTWNTYSSLEKYGDCFAISAKFKSLLNKEKQHKELTWAYFFEESIYNKLKQYDKALEINEIRLKLAREKDTTSILSALLDQADYKYYYLKDKEGAFTIMDSLLAHQENLNNNEKSFIHGEYGVYDYWEGDYRKALSNYLRSLDYLKKSDNPHNKKNRLAIAYGNIAEVAMELEQYDKASAYLDSVAFLGINSIERRLQKSFLHYHLQLASLTEKKISKVTRYLDTIYQHQDKVYADKYNHELVALSKANLNEQRLIKENQEIEIKSIKQRSRLSLLLALTVFLIIIGALFYRQRKNSFGKQSLQMQQRLLRSQMNPHFTFNTLYAIQNHLKTDQKGAIKYLLKFSGMLRLVLDNSINDYGKLENELESLRKYLDLQLFRFPTKFSYSIELEDLEEDDLLFIPPMLIQPFVENSIEHGFPRNDYNGKINIHLSMEGKFIRCIIDDNGVGIKKKQETKRKKSSTVLISEFIKKTTKHKVEILDKKVKEPKEHGVIVSFLIPYKLTEDD